MKQISTVADLQSTLQSLTHGSKKVGLVPTMGALHDGHLSLIEKARQENEVVVVSVFVNPIQFNNQEDLLKYPRTVEADCQELSQAGVDIAFTPSVEEMYPEPINRSFDFGELDKVMEGPRRPGHFNGVAIVVSRLFDLVKPDRAYFGEKDFQQLTIIRKMVEMCHYDITIVPCPIVRADDGLALSSRNARLSADARAIAPTIYATLKQSIIAANSLTVEMVKAQVIDQLSNYHLSHPLPNGLKFEPEYYEIVDSLTLQPLNSWKEATEQAVGCIAVWLDGVRLIDVVRYPKE